MNLFWLIRALLSFRARACENIPRIPQDVARPETRDFLLSRAGLPKVGKGHNRQSSELWITDVKKKNSNLVLPGLGALVCCWFLLKVKTLEGNFYRNVCCFLTPWNLEVFFCENTRRLACWVLHPLKRFRLGEVDEDVFRFLGAKMVVVASGKS